MNFRCVEHHRAFARWFYQVHRRRNGSGAALLHHIDAGENGQHHEARGEAENEQTSVDWGSHSADEIGVFGMLHTPLVERVVATGGLPDTAILTEGNDLAVSSWDILSGDAKPGTNVLIQDEAGDMAGLQAAELIAASGARVEILTRDRSLSPEVMGMNLVPAMRILQRLDTTFTVTWRLVSARRDGNLIRAEIGSDYGDMARVRQVDQIVVNNATRPLDELYFALRPLSVNLGEVDHEALVAGRPQAVATNPEGRFQLFRIGDAVAARNTHAAIHDALRLLKDL